MFNILLHRVCWVGIRLHGAHFLNLFEVKILKFRKIWEKNLDVDNDDFYRRKKYQRNIFYIMDYVKMTIYR
jgi:hypothetical protein